jgi:hypothetical protein
MITEKTLNPVTCNSADFSHQSTSIYGSRSLMIRLTMLQSVAYGLDQFDHMDNISVMLEMFL